MFLDLLKQELGDSRDAGNETRFNCPFCGSTKHKFYVQDTTGLWICFKCSEQGNPVSFVMKYYNVSYVEAIDILATFDYDVNAERQSQFSLNQYGDDLSDEEKLLLFITREGRPLDDDKQKTFKCPPPPTNCKNLMANFNNPEAFPFFGYLMRRGITLEHIQQHSISYVTEGEVELLDGRKMTLINHVVFFTLDENRKPLYWNTRSIDPDPFIKSFNAPSKEGEYSKQNTVFNLNNLQNADKIVVHEGVFDSIMTPGCGVATFGKKVTEEQVKLILKVAQKYKLPIYLYLDTDAWKEMITTADMIRSMDPNQVVYYVYSGSDLDANKLGFERVQELIDNAFLADSAGEMKLRMLNL
jgi:transcription elongation factor Elf1